MTNAQPTLEQTARAAELAPKVAALVPGIEWQPLTPQYPAGIRTSRDSALSPFDPRAFQAVLLALPDGVFSDLTVPLICRWREDGMRRSFFVWLLTPAGMLAFYEALVEKELSDV